MTRLLPPTFVLIQLCLMVVLTVLVPVLGPPPLLVRAIGAPLVLLGLVLLVSGSQLFDRVGTNIKTFDDPDVLVTAGLFGRTRNPMYLGFALFLAGAALGLGSLTAWFGPAFFLIAANFWYIPFEETRMAKTFHVEYDAYRSEVRRWV